MFTAIVLGLSFLAIPAAPEGISVLTVEVEGKISNVTLLRDNFSVLVQSHLSQPAVIGDTFSSLEMLLGCSKTRTDCLTQIATSLSVRWVIFGRLSKRRNRKFLFEVKLFDKNTKTIVAISKGELDSTGDREGLVRIIDVLFTQEATTPLKRLEPKTKIVEVEVPADTPSAISIKDLVLPGILGLGSAAFGTGVFLLLNDDKLNTGGQKTTILALSGGADVLLLAAGTTLVINLVRKKKSRAKRAKTQAALLPIPGGGVFASFSIRGLP